MNDGENDINGFNRTGSRGLQKPNKVRIAFDEPKLYICTMEIVIDTSIILAVLLNEPEKAQIIEMTIGCALLGPKVIPWEVGNALSAMVKRGRIKSGTAMKVMELFGSVPLRYVETIIPKALQLAFELNLYAYDAYFLECALSYRKPLLTLDQRLAEAAKRCSVRLLELKR